MKAKSIFQCAALLTGLLFLNVPLFAAVESDIVGYTTMNFTQKYNLVGVSFATLGGEDEIPVNEFISGEFTEGDQLQIQSGTGGYNVLEWRNSQWCGYGSSVASDRVVKRGTGVWIVTKQATTDNPVTAMVSGAVKLDNGLEVAFGQKYVIAAPGIPIEVAVNSNIFSWTDLSDGDQLQIPNGTGGYNVLQWKDGQWCGYGSNIPSERTIPVQTAVWIVSTSATAKVTINPSNL